MVNLFFLKLRKGQKLSEHNMRKIPIQKVESLQNAADLMPIDIANIWEKEFYFFTLNACSPPKFSFLSHQASYSLILLIFCHSIQRSLRLCHSLSFLYMTISNSSSSRTHSQSLMHGLELAHETKWVQKKNNKILLCLQFSQIKLDNKSLFVFWLCFPLVYCVYIYVSLSQFHFDHHYYYHSYYIHHFCSSPEFLHIIIYVVVHSIDRGHGPMCRVAMWVHAFDTSAYVSCTIPSITPPLIQHLSIQLTQNVKRKNACLVIIHTYI